MGKIVMKMRKTKFNPYYRLLALNKGTLQLILNQLATAPNSASESLHNTVILKEFIEIFSKLQTLNFQQITQLVESSDDLINVQINLSVLQERIDEMQTNNERYQEQLTQAKWLIEHKASNQQIISLCSMINQNEIKQLRYQTESPVHPGRKKLPDLETRLLIVDYWQKLPEKTEFLKYQQLLKHFPEYELGQLYSIVQDK